MSDIGRTAENICSQGVFRLLTHMRHQLDSADRQGEAVPEAKITRLNEKIAT
jgi:hypothetical protein